MKIKDEAQWLQDDFHFLQAYRQEAKLLSQLGQYIEAEKAWEKVWKECQKKFGEDTFFLQVAQLESWTAEFPMEWLGNGWFHCS